MGFQSIRLKSEGRYIGTNLSKKLKRESDLWRQTMTGIPMAMQGDAT